MQLTQTILEQARQLAAHYTDYEIRPDTATTGEPLYLASCRTLAGCLAQGETPETALANLKLARIDYIYSLLQDNLPIPTPITFIKIVTINPPIADQYQPKPTHTPTYQFTIFQS